MTERNDPEKNVDLITEELFREAYQYEEIRKPPLRKVIAKNFKCSKETVLNLFPIIKWLPKYSIKRDLINDIIAGVTVAVMHIPHGLAYAPLGRGEPVVGFYMAIFPVFIYMFMGTSRHISIGTFAVLCAMVGQIVDKYETPTLAESIGNFTNNATETSRGGYEGIHVASAVCLMVGIWQGILGLLRLGSLTVIMSESLVSGFTTGAAVHVLSYQLKNLFGVHVAAISGVLKILYIYIDFFSKIETVNLVTVIISTVSIIILFTFNSYIKPLVQKKFPKNKLPIPIELIVIVIGILISHFGKLSEKFNVRIVKYIPTGFPEPVAPPVTLLPSLIIESFSVAIVALAINLSLAKIFAKKDNYIVYNNQELIAYGTANIFASFFSCLPSAASLSRSTIQFSVGGKSQLASLFSITVIVFILLVAGSLFEPVPYCILSSIVVVTLKSLLMQIVDLPKIWKESYWDGIVWLGTFLAVVILDLDYGLGVGIFLSLTCIVFSSHSLQLSELGRVPNTNIFLDIEHYKSAQSIPNILILQIIGNLNFSNSSHFENLVLKKYNHFLNRPADRMNDRSYVILNMSSVAQIDPSSVNVLRHIYKFFKKSKCDLYLTDCNLKVYKTLGVCNLFVDLPKDQVLATVADAVEYLEKVT